MKKTVTVCDQCGQELDGTRYIHIDGGLSMVKADGALVLVAGNNSDWHPAHLTAAIQAVA